MQRDEFNWKDSGAWPFDAPGHVFMPRALHEIGRSIFGDKWTGKERPLPRLKQLKRGRIEYRTDTAALREIGKDGAERFQEAKRVLREHCAYGRLRACVQQPDGDFRDLPAHCWNTDEFWGLIDEARVPATCLYNVHPLADVRHYWLFVERRGLELISGQRPAEEDNQERDHDRQGAPDRAEGLLITADEVADRQFLFLGEAIEWIISRGQPVSSEDAVAAEDYAERQLFEMLDAGNVPVTGYRAGGVRVYEPLPDGIWARMNRGHHNEDPCFISVDDAEHRDNGGCVSIGDASWNGVRVPARMILDKWPPEGGAAEDGRTASDEEQHASTPRSQPMRDIAKRLIDRAFPEGTPRRGSMKAVEFVARVCKAHDNAKDGLLPRRDTILRAAGWRK